MATRRLAGAAALAIAVSWSSAASAADRTFAPGSLIIPMDLAYQDTGTLQAYGLIYQLLRQGVRVYWVIDPDKTYHAAPCNTPGDECPWDCAIEGSGVKCPYPTASPDFTAATKVVWHDRGTMAPGTAISAHAYRGGPFVIDSADRDRALPIVDAWNDATRWPANPWAVRTVAKVVTVHEATAPFTGDVAKEMLASPTIAVFSDGNEDIATGYLRAAGIPQSNGREFPGGGCGAGTCGPGTMNPDMLTVPSVMGDMGTCAAPNLDHSNGALFRSDGLPAFCQIMSMHWGVNDRETVTCEGGCGDSQAECGNRKITYHGHEVVAEVRAFLQYPVHFFAECQAVNAYENTTPNPAWPWNDDPGRDGHFLTTTGMPPACPCTENGFECVTGGCNGQDCCLPSNAKEKGAGFLIAPQPNSDTLKVLRPNVPYNQFDGAFQTVGGSEPAYNLSTYLQTKYKNDRQVTLITGPQGPGVSDVWMTGYLDGGCDIGPILKGQPREDCFMGKISYLGGHSFGTNTPISGPGSDTQGARLFLNALFEADCVTSAGQPGIELDLTPIYFVATSFPFEGDLAATYANTGIGAALDAILVKTLPDGVTAVSADLGGMTSPGGVTWDVGSVSGMPVRSGDPASAGGRRATVRFDAAGTYPVTLALHYKVGTSDITTTEQFMVTVGSDRDGDGVPDDADPTPDDPSTCGDSDNDGCDDCSNGPFDPANDCSPDPMNPGTGDGDSGCCNTNSGATSLAFSMLVLVVALRPRRRVRKA